LIEDLVNGADLGGEVGGEARLGLLSLRVGHLTGLSGL
jgi:hypothetical protein